MTHPLLHAYATAFDWVLSLVLPPRLRFITLAPWSAAQVMPLATLAEVPEPVLSNTLTGMIFVLSVSEPACPLHPEIPAMPIPLFVSAAAIPDRKSVV